MTIQPKGGAFRPALFDLGQIVASPGAIEATSHDHRLACLKRHVTGDWGLCCPDDQKANAEALREGFRILSVYPSDAGDESRGRLWIITEADRSVTTILLPTEY